MTVVGLVEVSLRHAHQQILDGVTLGIGDRDRIGVIGANGSGKTTLLRIVARDLEPDAGEVVWSDGLRVAHLAQDAETGPDRSVLDSVRSAPVAFDPLTDRADAQRQQRAVATLHRLDIAELDRSVATLSGGQRKRVALARALAEPSDLLILDEPTNHLDVAAVEWLEGQLDARSGALLLVTHDRYLLDRVATRIVEVADGRVQSGYGSYGDYLQARTLREQHAVAADQRRANRARIELAWLRRGPRARTSKARYRVERAREVLDGGAGPPRQELTLGLPARRLGSKVVNLHNAGKRYGDHVVLSGVDRKLKLGDRIGVVGPNGSGKTTFLRLIAGRLAPDEGKVVIGDTVVVGWYDQELDTGLDPSRRVLEVVDERVRTTELADGTRIAAGGLLERFLFDNDAQRSLVGELSGGERRRLQLLLVLATAPNVLLLDEPTNDLDLDTLAVLEEYLDDWPGVLVAATHDRYFLDRVCDDVLAVAGGTVTHHPGGGTAWRAAQRDTPRDGPRDDTQPPAAERLPRRPRKLAYHERRELDALNRRLPVLEARKAELSAALQERGDDYPAARAIAEELDDVLGELAAAEDRWLLLSEIAEAG